MEADVAGGPHAAAQARRLVEQELDGRLPPRMVEDVSLLVTELVANGVRHGGGADDEASLRVLLEGRRPCLHVEVANADHVRGVPVRRAADLEGGGGIGLNLVERLASRWGVIRRPETTVWFEMDC